MVLVLHDALRGVRPVRELVKAVRDRLGAHVTAQTCARCRCFLNDQTAGVQRCDVDEGGLGGFGELCA
ncbi:hypothetical protein V474_12105 [Novosphingobium barchaimii LL02]|uniref:Uncharacterized protein n=1 Tax=Novosphingobium barchaimii LL02 TaxID=1114963 RepID=A0A0J7Y805_9SPHN|nr:hypothetical protein V474_12105 [Novosphingobium barchaimii LL02]